MKDLKIERLEKEEIPEKDQKEALIFEAEKYGLKIDIKTKEEIERRSELKKLKQELKNSRNA